MNFNKMNFNEMNFNEMTPLEGDLAMKQEIWKLLQKNHEFKECVSEILVKYIKMIDLKVDHLETLKTSCKYQSCVLIGQDENGGNIYRFTLENGEYFDIVAPKGNDSNVKRFVANKYLDTDGWYKIGNITGSGGLGHGGLFSVSLTGQYNYVKPTTAHVNIAVSFGTVIMNALSVNYTGYGITKIGVFGTPIGNEMFSNVGLYVYYKSDNTGNDAKYMIDNFTAGIDASDITPVDFEPADVTTLSAIDILGLHTMVPKIGDDLNGKNVKIIFQNTDFYGMGTGTITIFKANDSDYIEADLDVGYYQGYGVFSDIYDTSYVSPVTYTNGGSLTAYDKSFITIEYV